MFHGTKIVKELVKGNDYGRKFVVERGNDTLFLKTGESSTIHEFLYAVIAEELGFVDILPEFPELFINCTHKTYGVGTKFLTNITGGEIKTKIARKNGKFELSVDNVWDACILLEPRSMRILIVDMLMGNHDRMANCHRINGTLYAIDNDVATVEKTFDFDKEEISMERITWARIPGLRRHILHSMLDKEETQKALRSVDFDLNVLQIDSIRERLKPLLACGDLESYSEKLIEAILWRRDIIAASM